jgi:hypothetical protein
MRGQSRRSIEFRQAAAFFSVPAPRYARETPWIDRRKALAFTGFAGGGMGGMLSRSRLGLQLCHP